MPSWAHLIHIISKTQTGRWCRERERVGRERQVAHWVSLESKRAQCLQMWGMCDSITLWYCSSCWVSPLSLLPLFLFSPSFPLPLCVCAPLSVICSYFGLLILRAETFCKCFHYASHVAKRQRQRRLQAEGEATLITLCLSLINFCRIYYLNAFMCVCSAHMCVCVWLKGASKIGTSFWSEATSLQKSIKSDTCESCKHPSHEYVCVCVRACWTMRHAPFCVCESPTLCSTWALRVCVWFGCFNPFRFAINSFCLFTFRLCRQQKSLNTL